MAIHQEEGRAVFATSGPLSEICQRLPGAKVEITYISLEDAYRIRMSRGVIAREYWFSPETLKWPIGDIIDVVVLPAVASMQWPPAKFNGVV